MRCHWVACRRRLSAPCKGPKHIIQLEVKYSLTPEEYRSQLVGLRAAYVQLLQIQRPRRTLSRASTLQDQLCAIHGDLVILAQDVTRDIRAIHELAPDGADPVQSQLPQYGRLVLDASSLSKRIVASLREVNGYFCRMHPLLGGSKPKSARRSRRWQKPA
jgi:hypothetical protein